MAKRVAVTTIDNPFDPIDDFDRWYSFDVEKGYHTSELLARVAFYSSELSEQDQMLIVEAAVDEIVSLNVTGLYKKVVRAA